MTVDCPGATTMLDELALDVLPGDRRAELLAHVEECPNCRRLLEQLSETADDLLLAGPAAVPPAGFEDGVMGRIQESQGRARQRAGRRGPLRLPVPAAAAAAAVLLILGGVTGAVLGRAAGDDNAGRGFRTVDLVASGGVDVGDVATYYGRSPWYFMQLEGALPDGSYRCVLEMDDGRIVPLGHLHAVDGRGGWGNRVSVDPRQVRIARLVDSRGTTVATARLH